MNSIAKLSYVQESKDVNNDEKIQVLFIEDEEQIRQHVISDLQNDCFVDSVNSPLDAINLLKEKNYDVVLTDIRFDGINSTSGDEFIRDNISFLKQSKIIAYTGFAADIASENRRFFDNIIAKGSEESLYQTIKQTLQTVRQDKFSHAKPNVQEELIALSLFQDKMKLIPFAKDKNYKITDANEYLHNILYTFTSETTELKNSIEELESLVNDRNSTEKDFQDFFTRNKDFILGEDYIDAHPHIYLEKDDGKVLIPDFMLEPVDQDKLCDLLELKLPFAPLYNLKKNRERFSTAIVEAYAQLGKYNNYFEEERNREKIRQKYGLVAFKPKMFVIIGRNKTIDPIDRKQIESMFPSLNVKNYDEIIERKKYKLENWIKGKKL